MLFYTGTIVVRLKRERFDNDMIELLVGGTCRTPATPIPLPPILAISVLKYVQPLPKKRERKSLPGPTLFSQL